MNRQQVVLAGLGLLVIVILFFMFVFRPKQEEIADLEAQLDEAVAQEATLEAQIAALEEIRSRAPEIEADLAKIESIVPREQALPSALRQLQLAADDSGAVLVTVTPGRPVALEAEATAPAVEGPPTGLAELSVSLVVEGSYFQLVDFLRRIEDPAIVPRGITWSTLTVATTEYPTLTANLAGRMFAVLPLPAAEVPPAVEGTEPPTEPDVDATVEEEAA